MNSIKTVLTLTAMSWGVVLSMPALAQANMDHSKMGMSQEASMMTDGEVRKIDQAAGKLTLKHGEIKNLDMPGMTMVFAVKDKALLNNLKPGDKVKFMVVNEAGKMIVTDIQPAK
ncbi:copper-binding protein [Uliginosibacterium sp. 31-16]|uniref:copper-binding protein n=1 Tax=Uliginosibacterium sp. 31-16 TaxID=3068315 RepID=UPI00273E244B|nr:copper-binding protein [Uliginosibacterium sp. 31-16]MDP5239503.1 copper-binding protein [Uliginosibacterium sp. 31-16]